MKSWLLATATILAASATQLPAEQGRPATPQMSNVVVSPSFFNPTLGQSVQIRLTLRDPGRLTVRIADAAGKIVRHLVEESPANAGIQSRFWDGKDDSGAVVGDDGYALVITHEGNTGLAMYAPSAASSPVRVETPKFDPSTGVVRYVLPVPARVSLRVSAARGTPKGGSRSLVRSECRVSGAIVEPWDGWDDSASSRLLDAGKLEFELRAIPLPENTIITVGNRNGVPPAGASLASSIRSPEIGRRNP